MASKETDDERLQRLRLYIVHCTCEDKGHCNVLKPRGMEEEEEEEEEEERRRRGGEEEVSGRRQQGANEEG